MLGQTSFPDNFTKGFAGGQVDIGPEDIKSRASVEKIDFGSIMVDADDSGTSVKLPSADQIILDADLITDNVIAGSIVVKALDVAGANSSVSVPFNSTHDLTMDDLATALTAIDGILSASKGGTSNWTMTIVPEQGYSVEVVGDFAVTAGLTQAGITYNSTTGFSYVAISEQKEQDQNGDVYYSAGETVNSGTQGRVWVPCETSFNNTSDVYVRIITDGDKLRGAIRTDSDSGKALLWSDAKINDSGSSSEVAELEINLP